MVGEITFKSLWHLPFFFQISGNNLWYILRAKNYTKSEWLEYKQTSRHLAGCRKCCIRHRTEVAKWDQRLIYRKLDTVTHLLILQFNSNYPEGVRGCVVVYVDSAESLLSRFDWHPFLTGIVIDHNWSSGLANTLFTGEKKQQNQERKQWIYCLLLKTSKGKKTNRNYQYYLQHMFYKRSANPLNAIC